MINVFYLLYYISMNKKTTKLHHSKLSNDLMNYINNNINTDINIEQLSLEYGISKCHFHKIFKEYTGGTIYQFIKSVRLQKASNMLIANKDSTITQISNLCGYSSQTSFIKAFKQRFNQTPKIWRNGGYKEYSNHILSLSLTDTLSYKDFSYIVPNIVKVKSRTAYYIRQKGYLYNNIRHTWQQMMAWTYTNNLKDFEQIGIYHDNPLITPLGDCYYVACIVPNEKTPFKKDQNLPNFEIHDSICMTFEFEGKHEDILKLIRWVNHYWLPNSGFEITTIPSYTIFKDNHFLNKDGIFRGTYYIPVESIL